MTGGTMPHPRRRLQRSVGHAADGRSRPRGLLRKLLGGKQCARDHDDQGGTAARAAVARGGRLRRRLLPARLELEPTVLQGSTLVAAIEPVGPDHLQPRDGHVLEQAIEELLHRQGHRAPLRMLATAAVTVAEADGGAGEGEEAVVL